MSEITRRVPRTAPVQTELPLNRFVNHHIDNGCPGWADDWEAHAKAEGVTLDRVTLFNLEDVRTDGHWCSYCILRTPEYQAELAAAGITLDDLRAGGIAI